MQNLNNWIEKIQQFFSGATPDGFSLNWDESRFFKLLSDRFSNFNVNNNTDFNYSYCNSFDIKLPASLLNGNYIITLKLSFVLDAFVLFITSYSSDFKKGKVISISDVPELKGIYSDVTEFAESLGFEEVNDK